MECKPRLSIVVKLRSGNIAETSEAIPGKQFCSPVSMLLLDSTGKLGAISPCVLAVVVLHRPALLHFRVKLSSIEEKWLYKLGGGARRSPRLSLIKSSLSVAEIVSSISPASTSPRHAYHIHPPWYKPAPKITQRCIACGVLAASRHSEPSTWSRRRS